tara:strand:+ start:1838 stop:2383 length:546 start_codon:yes stop_codon:yes gene_type:complete
MSKLTEKKINSKIVYKGNFLDVRKDNVTLPNGKNSTREWINHPGAVVVVPILPNGEIALIRQFRYAMGSEFIELPAGKLDKGEKPYNCAKRELEEEIGFKAKKLNFIAMIHPAIGFANEHMSVFLASDLIQTKENRDVDEFLELMPTSLNDALELVWSNKITDVKTIIGILWYQRIFNKSR